MVRTDLGEVDRFFNTLTEDQQSIFLVIFKGDRSDDAARYIEAKLLEEVETVGKVLAIIEEVWGLEPGTIKTKLRKDENVMARAHYYKVMGLYTNLSYVFISFHVNRNHATVSHALNKAWSSYLNSKHKEQFIANLRTIKERLLSEVFNQTHIEHEDTAPS
jgi:hypothetical protein